MRIGFIGGGRMAEAMIAALIRGRVARARDVFVSDISSGRRRALKAAYGVNVRSRNGAVAESAGVLVLAVKPQDLDGALRGLARDIGGRHLLMSIAAGRKLAFLEALAPRARIIRVMPNLACQVSEGMSVFCCGTLAAEKDRATARRILSSFGVAAEMPESRFDAVTALSGSGPAFLAGVLDGLVAGAVEEGMAREDALLLARQTMLGTAGVLIERGLSPAELITAVASPGGTTAAGLSVMDGSDLREVLIRTIKAAARRSRELSG